MDDAHDRAVAIAEATQLGLVLRSAWRGEPMEESGGLVEALVDAARALDEAGVGHAVIGGFAVGMHTTPRATLDGVHIRPGRHVFDYFA